MCPEELESASDLAGRGELHFGQWATESHCVCEDAEILKFLNEY